MLCFVSKFKKIYIKESPLRKIKVVRPLPCFFVFFGLSTFYSYRTNAYKMNVCLEQNYYYNPLSERDDGNQEKTKKHFSRFLELYLEKLYNK